MVKNTFILLLSIIFTLNINAQTWFELGLKGGPSATFLMNSNIFEDMEFNHKITPTYFYGAKVGINFGPHNGIALHGGGTQIRQNFINQHPNNTFSERNFSSKAIEFGALYHRSSVSGYFEVGPRISLVRNPTMMDDNGERIPIENNLNKSYYGADIGFGGYMIGNERISLMMGIRVSYSFTPLSDSDRPFTDNIVSDIYANQKNTHVMAAMLCFELNYSLGYLVRSNCGDRTNWISF